MCDVLYDCALKRNMICYIQNTARKDDAVLIAGTARVERRTERAGRETEAHTSRSSSSWSFVLDDAVRLPPESPPSPSLALSLALSLVLRILPPLLFALALGCEWHTHRWKLSRSSSSAVSRLPTGMSNSLWLHCSAM